MESGTIDIESSGDVIVNEAIIKDCSIGETFMCFFCCKSVDICGESDSPRKSTKRETAPGGGGGERNVNVKVILERFFNLVNRQFNFACKNSFETIENFPHVCFHCLEIIEQFCMLYHQLKCLELQLNWQVEKLWNVMRFADRVPSRVQAFEKWCVSTNNHKGLIGNAEGYNVTTQQKKVNFTQLIKLRKSFKRQCKRYRSKTLPRVRISVESTNGEAKSIPQNKTKNYNDFSNTGTNFISNNANVIENNSSQKQNEYYFFGWIMSFTTIIFLYNLTTIGSHYGRRSSSRKEKKIIIETQSFSAQLPTFLNVPGYNDDAGHAMIEMDEQDISNSAASIISESSVSHDDTESDNDYSEANNSIWNNVEEVEDQKFDPSSLSSQHIQNENAADDGGHFSGDNREVTDTFTQQPHSACSKSNSSYSSTVPQVPTGIELESELTINDLTNLVPTTSSVIQQGHPITSSLLLPVPTIKEVDSLNVGMSAVKLYQPPSLSVEEGNMPIDVPPPNQRSLRQKFQCTICKATFASSERLDYHSSVAHVDCIDLEVSGGSDDEEKFNKIDKSIQEFDINWNGGRKFSKKRSKIDLERTNVEIKSEPESEIDDDDNKIDISSSSETDSEDEEEKSSTNIHKCFKCTPNFEFETDSKLDHHMKYFHSNGNSHIDSFSCRHIKITQLNLEGLPQNFSEQKCPAKGCLKVFALPQELKKHSEIFHGSGDEKNGMSLSCHFCDLQKPCPIDLINHELEHSVTKQQLENGKCQPGKRFICRRCNVATETKPDFINHYLEIHLEISPIQATCSICRKTFQTESVPIHHYINYHDLNRLDDPTSPFRCKEAECPAYFLTDDQLHFHYSTHHPNLSLCDDNSKKYVEKMNKRLKKQERKKLKLQARMSLLVCPQCPGKTFYKDSKFRIHTWLDKHGGDSPENKGKIVISAPDQGLTVNDLVYDRKAKFYCSLEHCKKGFMEEQDLETHSKLHGQFKCNFCEVVKTFAPEIAMHETVHLTREKIVERKTVKNQDFWCTRCSFSTSIKYDYMEHHVEQHLGLVFDKIRCPICKYVYKCAKGKGANYILNLKTSMVTHYVNFHDVESNSEVHRCEQCTAYFLNSLQLQRHNLDVHGEKPITRTKHKYDCKDCGTGFNRSSTLRLHKRKFHKSSYHDFQFVCKVPKCEKRLETWIGMKNHMRKMHSNTETKLMCPKENCGKFFLGECALKSHLRGNAHNKAAGRICDECGKVFCNNYKLARHKMTHAAPETWKFSCPYCNKKASQLFNLKVHIRTHTKEKNEQFICQICGSIYSHSHNLKLHMDKKHTDLVKPHNRVNAGVSRKKSKSS